MSFSPQPTSVPTPFVFADSVAAITNSIPAPTFLTGFTERSGARQTTDLIGGTVLLQEGATGRGVLTWTAEAGLGTGLLTAYTDGTIHARLLSSIANPAGSAMSDTWQALILFKPTSYTTAAPLLSCANGPILANLGPGDWGLFYETTTTAGIKWSAKQGAASEFKIQVCNAPAADGTVYGIMFRKKTVLDIPYIGVSLNGGDVAETAISLTGITGSTKKLTLGGKEATAFAMNVMNIFLVAVWNDQTLTDAQMKLLSADPYQLVTLAAPDQATVPSPTNESTDNSYNPTFSWVAGARTLSHNVYFGTENPPVTLIGNQINTTYVPGTLIPGITYYWRIDEVGFNGTTKGEVWSFITAYEEIQYYNSADKSNLLNNAMINGVTCSPKIVLSKTLLTDEGGVINNYDMDVNLIEDTIIETDGGATVTNNSFDSGDEITLTDNGATVVSDIKTNETIILTDRGAEVIVNKISPVTNFKIYRFGQKGPLTQRELD